MYQTAFSKLDEDDDLQPMLKFLKIDLKAFAQEANGVTTNDFRYVQLYFEQVLPEFTKNHLLWEMYVDHCQSICSAGEKRLDVFRRALKNCNQISKFWLALFQESEKCE